VAGAIGDGSDAPIIPLTLYLPAKAQGRVPVILVVNFGGGAGPAPAAVLPSGEPPVATEIIGRGWGYATIAYQDIQPDRRTSLDEGVIARARAAGQTPALDDWGAIGAWSWGVSRAIDYLEKDPAVDAKRIAVQGHSRIGKTALWASANDTRIAAVFSSCAGEMGSALSRRDWGETVDDMTQNFPWWFSGSFQKWAGRWDEMPVDAHMLIALSAPRPLKTGAPFSSFWISTSSKAGLGTFWKLGNRVNEPPVVHKDRKLTKTTKRLVIFVILVILVPGS
jgi:hypothetical protein